jgi:site-specific DNA recombinase
MTAEGAEEPHVSNTDRKKYAVGYVRLSDYRGEADPSTSPERQREAIAAMCVARGWTLLEIVEDLNVSGSDRGLRLDRPGLQRVQSLYNRADVLVFTKMDRLARNVTDFRAIADEAKRQDVALVSIDDNIDLTTASGTFFATILAAFAEMEAATIRQRVLEGIARVKAIGRYAGGNNLPFGYASAPAPTGGGRILVPVAEEAALAREMADRVLAGESLYAITRSLNERGVPSKTGKAWSIQAVRQVVTGPAIVGRLTHRGEVIRGEDGLPLQAFEPVLSVETWRAVRTLLGADLPAAKRTRRTKAARLLSGLIQCGRCGAPMYPATSGGGKSYRCSTASRGQDCVGVSVRCEAVEDHVSAVFLRLYGRLPVREVVTTTPPEPAELIEVEHAIQETTDAMRTADDLAPLLERLTGLKEKRETLRSAPVEPTVEVIETGRTFGDTWADSDGDVDRQRALLSDGVSAVVVAPGRAGRRPFAPERVSVVPREGVSTVDLDGESLGPTDPATRARLGLEPLAQGGDAA